MITDLFTSVFGQMFDFNLAGQFIWLIVLFFAGFCVVLAQQGPLHRLVVAAPSLLISMGMLGTFAGIVIGLDEVGNADVQGDLSGLLGGIGAAFHSSLAGMGLSILFRLLVALRPTPEDGVAAGADAAERLVAETANLGKHLRQANLDGREHSEYLIALTNAIADRSDDTNVLGRLATLEASQRQIGAETLEALEQLQMTMALRGSAGGASANEFNALEREAFEREMRSHLGDIQSRLEHLPSKVDAAVDLDTGAGA